MERKIKIEEYIHKKEVALIGRNNGEETLNAIESRIKTFEELEQAFDKITIEVPERIITINKSYFLGMFELAIDRLGKEGFENKYIFDTTPHIIEKIKSMTQYALLDATQEEIVND